MGLSVSFCLLILVHILPKFFTQLVSFPRAKFYVITFFQTDSWSTCGGCTVYDAVKRILEGVLGQLINWTGQGEKRSFRSLHLRTILESEYRVCDN